MKRHSMTQVEQGMWLKLLRERVSHSTGVSEHDLEYWAMTLIDLMYDINPNIGVDIKLTAPAGSFVNVSRESGDPPSNKEKHNGQNRI